MGKKQKEKKSMSLAEFQESVGGGKPVTATPSFAYSSRGAGKVADEDVQLPSAPLGEEEWEARGIPAFGRHAGKPMREFRDDDQFDELRDKDWVRRGPMEGGGGGLERGGFGASEGMGGVDPDAVNWERRGPIAAEGGPGTASRGELDWSARRGPVTSAAETGAGGLGDFGAPKDVDWSNARKGPLELSTPLGEGSDEFGAPKVVDWSRARQGPLSPATGAGASSILDRERDGDVDWNAARRGPLENGTQPVAPVDFTDVRGKMVSVAAESDGTGTHNHHQRDSRSEIDWNKRKGPVEARPSRPDAGLIPERGAKLMELGSQKKELVLRGGGVKAEAGDERNWEGARAAVTPTSTATEKEERESDAKDGDDAAKSSRQGNSHTAAKPHASPNGIGADTRNRDIDWARGRGSPAVSSGPVEKGHEHQDKAGQKGAQAHGRGPRGHHTPELQTNAHGHGHGDSATLHPSERDWSTARNATATVGPVRKDRDSNSKRSGKNSSAASPPASASVDAEVARQDNVASTESITSVPETTTSASSVEEDAGEWHEVGAGRKKEKGPNTSKVAGSGGGGQGPRKQFSIPKSSEAKGKGTECSSRKPRGEGNQQGGKSSTDKRDRQNKGHGKRDGIEKDEFVRDEHLNGASPTSSTGSNAGGAETITESKNEVAGEPDVPNGGLTAGV
ncbi:hypothetical protein FVE85_7974 [Porphyridium purpureum]|uniref:Uncharacterized protein n=1 Tax=Porphyridium purpureum TaxID=35688 RepID=A0A5J4YPY3_PORPP|nr:hypothetical protein FVE85_7974 [Porphyridium purpureum]|eukprot:POR4215..scf295_9